MKILIISSICSECIQTLQNRHDVVCCLNADQESLQAAIVDRDVVIFRSGVQLTSDVLSKAPDLRLLIRGGCGLDNVDLDYVRQHDIRLQTIPGPSAQAVAEMAFALMLCLARGLLQADQLLRRGRWAKHEISGFLLRGKRLGVVGAGNIGSRVGQMGHAWGMDVVGCVESPSAEVGRKLANKGIQLTTLDEVVRSSDFVSIHVPFKDSTRNLIDKRVLELMKTGAFLVNLARGGVADEMALYDALTRPGGLAGAALDVHEHEGEGKVSPLARLPNVVLTPHIGASTKDSQRQIGQHILEIIERFDSTHS